MMITIEKMTSRSDKIPLGSLFPMMTSPTLIYSSSSAFRAPIDPGIASPALSSNTSCGVEATWRRLMEANFGFYGRSQIYSEDLKMGCFDEETNLWTVNLLSCCSYPFGTAPGEFRVRGCDLIQEIVELASFHNDSHALVLLLFEYEGG